MSSYSTALGAGGPAGQGLAGSSEAGGVKNPEPSRDRMRAQRFQDALFHQLTRFFAFLVLAILVATSPLAIGHGEAEHQKAGPVMKEQKPWGIAGDVKFTDPEIESAFDAVGEILLNPDYVNAGFGDVKSINTTAFADVAAKLADGTCALTHQGSFLTANLLTTKTADGETPEIAPDGDVYAFIMPGMTEGELQVEVGGEFVVGFSDDAATQAVLEFMASKEFADARVEHLAPKESEPFRVSAVDRDDVEPDRRARGHARLVTARVSVWASASTCRRSSARRPARRRSRTPRP